MAEGAQPSGGLIRSRGAIIGLLTGLNLFNYLDRYVVTAVSPRIQETFRLSNLRTGLVLSAFMIGYFLTSPIFGTLGDRHRRRGLIFLGVAAWSIATAASGFATSFWQLLAARVLVGVGEASYATLAPTIIGDLTTPQTRNRWLALFYGAIPVGSAAGYAAGGLLEKAFGDWRQVFYVAAGPGLALGIAMLFVAEPPRAASRPPPTGLASVRELFANPIWRAAVLGDVAFTFATGGFAAWAPNYLLSTLSMPLERADRWIGRILAIAGLVGTAFGGWLADKMTRGDPSRDALRFCAIFTLPAVPFVLVCLLASKPVGFFLAFCATGMLLFVSTAPLGSALLGSVPLELRAQGMALSIFATHLLGDLVSPPLIGLAADLAGDLRSALLVLIPGAIATSGMLWWWGSKSASLSPRFSASPE